MMRNHGPLTNAVPPGQWLPNEVEAAKAYLASRVTTGAMTRDAVRDIAEALGFIGYEGAERMRRGKNPRRAVWRDPA